MTDLTKLTIDELRNLATADFERDWDERFEAVTELCRRIQTIHALQEAAQQAIYQGLTERDNGVIELQPGEPLRAKLIVLRNALADAKVTQTIDHEPIEMHSCEISFLILHPNTLYRFTPAPGCQACADYHNPKRSPRKLHKSIVITLTLALVASLITTFLTLAQLS